MSSIKVVPNNSTSAGNRRVLVNCATARAEACSLVFSSVPQVFEGPRIDSSSPHRVPKTRTWLQIKFRSLNMLPRIPFSKPTGESPKIEAAKTKVKNKAYPSDGE